MHALLDLIFPPRCAGCDRPGILLCAECATRIPRIELPTACPACGAPRIGHCVECSGRRFAFAGARCAALLGPPVSRAVVLLKDGGERRYARLLGSLLAEAAEGWLSPAEVLVPVPASPAAVRRRGFDQADDIARALGGITGSPVVRSLCAHVSADQRALGRQERFENRRAMFALSRGAQIPLRVVLVDDVFTTGATLDSAARALRESGAAEVRALAVARAVGRVPAE